MERTEKRKHNYEHEKDNLNVKNKTNHKKQKINKTNNKQNSQDEIKEIKKENHVTENINKNKYRKTIWTKQNQENEKKIPKFLISGSPAK